MKNLILLFLVIGAAVSQITLTTNATATSPVWTLTYGAPVAGLIRYSFTLTYYAGTASSSVSTANTQNIGVACWFTDSAFALASPATAPGISFSVPGSGSAATTAASTAWGTLAMSSHAALVHTSDLLFDSGNTVSCPIVMTQTGQPLPVVSAFTATWTFTVLNFCGTLPQHSNAYFGRCVSVADQAKVLTTAGGVLAVDTLGAKNVTVTVATTTCATTTGASTFATGATILAGIAYLQF
jgi:hypothetical protein